MNKIYAAVRVLGLLLAIVAAFVAIPNLNVAAALVILGVIWGLGATEETAPRLLIGALVLPVIVVALANVPEIGAYLGAIATNLGLSVAGAAATVIGTRIVNSVKNDWATPAVKS